MPDAAPFLNVSDFTAGYKRGLPILHGVSMHVNSGEIVTVIGPNGAGKSTLIKAIAGLVIVEGGAITLEARNLLGIAPDRLGRFGLSYVPQTANIFTTLSVSQNLALAARRCRAAPETRIAAMLDLFPALAERRSVRGGGLSGGQRQVLAIAMALIAEPRIILMDEPTAGLSPKASQDVLELIGKIAGDGVSVLLVEQNARMALGISDRAYILADGQNQMDGPAGDILDDPAVAEIYLGGRRKGAA
ncbi:ABC transporter ATP-binding protein [Hoeflea poritis]|uniref:ABC transporter ATP-binding protein n=1 Tax=Hoeflea poritis TaxID=2993659 RepID=A0ABT4VQ18_9HYPH|nr:ABC transporter ATP-binding protein [Hoeflea poritis]MDA4846172.1 ABC transporter ATP-binding protein [Hoeflea poritis]